MRYHCRRCDNDFDVLAWIVETTNFFPSYDWTQPEWNPPSSDPSQPQVQVTTNYTTSTSVKKPCCPFCQSLEIEENKNES